MRKKTLLLALVLALPASAMTAHAGSVDQRISARHSHSRLNIQEDLSERNDRVSRHVERRQARKRKAEHWE
jgi:hypothetical protein